LDLKIKITEPQYEALKAVAEASGDSLDKWLHTTVIQGIEADFELCFGTSENIKEKLYKKLAATMGEELTTQELIDLRVILISFMADKEAHKKMPRLESRAPKLWDKVDRMYKYKQKGSEDRS
jgi:hypothetical protein